MVEDGQQLVPRALRHWLHTRTIRSMAGRT